MAGNTHQIDIHRLYIEGNFTERLRRIRMEQYAARTGDFADFSQRLNHPNLVINRHHADQQGRIFDGCLQLVKINQPIGFNRKIRYLKPLHFHMARRVEHAFMLGHHGDDMVFFRLVKLTHPLERNVVGFRRARGENNLFFICMNHPRYLTARQFAGFFCLPAIGMAARMRIAEFFGEIGQHYLQHARIYRRRGLVIHENRHLRRIFYLI